jgi:transcriptional regulator with XRE-family HTH domain
MSLKFLRKQAGLAQKELAQKIGVSRAYISQLENQRYGSNVTIEIIDNLSMALNTCPLYMYMYFSSCPKCQFFCHNCNKAIKTEL